jgi:hypothetical protein
MRSAGPTAVRLPTRDGAMADSDEDEERVSFASLPPAVQREVLRRMPVDARARAACVCPSWRTTLEDVGLWTRLDLTRSSGVTCTVNAAALRGAAAKARGGLTALDVSGCRAIVAEHYSTALWHVVVANAGTLRELRACESSMTTLEALDWGGVAPHAWTRHG